MAYVKVAFDRRTIKDPNAKRSPLKVHYRGIPFIDLMHPNTDQSQNLTLCGRAEQWARRATRNEDEVTCEPCLKYLVQESLARVEENQEL